MRYTVEDSDHIVPFDSKHNLRIKKANSVMQASNGSPLSYEDFEPFCNWHRDDESVTLVVHIPAFKRSQLKIQVNHTTNTVKISGERLVDATKRSRFYKEITIPKDCKSTEVHAKFIGGLLHVVMPKKKTLLPGNVAVLENDDTQLCNLISSKRLLKTARNVAAVVAVMAGLIAYIMYSYRHLYIED